MNIKALSSLLLLVCAISSLEDASAMGRGRPSDAVMTVRANEPLVPPSDGVAFLCESEEYEFYYRHVNPMAKHTHGLVMHNKITGADQYFDYAYSQNIGEHHFNFRMFGIYSHLTIPFGGHSVRPALVFTSPRHQALIQSIVDRFNAMNVSSVSSHIQWRSRDYSVAPVFTIIDSRNYVQHPVTCISVPEERVPARFVALERDLVTQLNLLLELNNIQDIGSGRCARQAAASRYQLMSVVGGSMEEIDASVEQTHALCMESVNEERVRALEAYLY